MGSKGLQKSAQVRRAQAAAFLESGLTARDWCAENGVGEGTLRYWLRKLREEGADRQGWVDIGALAGTGACTAIVPSGRAPATVRVGPFSIEVTPDTDAGALRAALAAAASLC